MADSVYMFAAQMSEEGCEARYSPLRHNLWPQLLLSHSITTSDLCYKEIPAAISVLCQRTQVLKSGEELTQQVE